MISRRVLPPAVSRAVAAAAILALFALPPLYGHGLGGAALYNGDEAIYAQMAREMVAARRPSELSFDGELLFPRPPAAVWAIAAAYAIGGEVPPEPAVRVVDTTLCALAVALTIALGTLLWSPFVGLFAGGLLAFADLQIGYARVYESEPLLVCCVLAALCGWALRSRAGWLLFGVGLGGALLTKQLVGFLPLIGPLADAVAARDRAPEEARGGLVTGLLVALAIALPWHLLMLHRHGASFVDSFFVRSLLGRGGTAFLRRTRPTFYLHELFKSEDWFFALLFLGGSIALLSCGLRRRSPAALAIGGWAIGVLGVYSLARSRYDYYLLLCYPAFALAGAWTIAQVPIGRMRPWLAAVIVALSALAHLPRNLVPERGDEETRAILSGAGGVTAKLPLYTLGMHPYTARLYGDRPVQVFVESSRDLEAARAVRATGMPAPAILATPAARAIELARRPALLLYPRARIELLDGIARDRYRVVGESPRLRLLLLP